MRSPSCLCDTVKAAEGNGAGLIRNITKPVIRTFAALISILFVLAVNSPAVLAAGPWVFNDNTAGTSASGQAWIGIATSASGQYVAATTVLTSGSSGDIWVSNDYGVTWRNATAGTAASGAGWRNITMSSSGQYIYANSASPSDVWASNDFGVSWTDATASSAATGSTFDAITTDASGQDVVAGVFSGDIWASHDFGSSWTNVTSGQPASGQSYFGLTSSADGKYLTAAAGANGLWTSSDSGTTWTLVSGTSGVASFRTTASSASGQYQLASTFGGSLWTSSNYGATWAPAFSGVSGFAQWGAAVSSTGQYMFALTEVGGDVWVSSDYGATWANDTAGTSASGSNKQNGTSYGLRVIAASANAQHLYVAYDVPKDIFVADNLALDPSATLSVTSSPGSPDTGSGAPNSHNVALFSVLGLSALITISGLALRARWSRLRSPVISWFARGRW